MRRRMSVPEALSIIQNRLLVTDGGFRADRTFVPWRARHGGPGIRRMDTLLHEMIHQWQDTRRIPLAPSTARADTSTIALEIPILLRARLRLV